MYLKTGLSSRLRLALGLIFVIGGIVALVIPGFEWPRLFLVAMCAVFGFIFLRSYFLDRRESRKDSHS